VKWALAVGRAWRLPVVWEAADEPQALTAEVVNGHGQHVHYHLHLAPGMSPADVAALIQAASAPLQPRAGIARGPGQP
jgi:hypothetical protein